MMRIMRNVPLSRLTTIGLGGEAKRVFYPDSSLALIDAVRLCEEKDEKYFVLGAGSNVLPADAGYDGTLIVTTDCARLCAEGETIRADCGAMTSAIAAFCRARRLSGWEFFASIPASVGGMVTMNAGACGLFMSDIVLRVHAYMDNRCVWLDRKDCHFGAKESIFQTKGLVLAAEFSFFASSREESAAALARCGKMRSRQPKGRSMGCVFCNPPGISAGALIQRCGLCGVRVGGAVISEEHGNFILNAGGATERDVRTLIELARERVLRECGVALQEEIIYLR